LFYDKSVPFFRVFNGFLHIKDYFFVFVFLVDIGLLLLVAFRQVFGRTVAHHTFDVELLLAPRGVELNLLFSVLKFFLFQRVSWFTLLLLFQGFKRLAVLFNKRVDVGEYLLKVFGRLRCLGLIHFGHELVVERIEAVAFTVGECTGVFDFDKGVDVFGGEWLAAFAEVDQIHDAHGGHLGVAVLPLLNGLQYAFNHLGQLSLGVLVATDVHHDGQHPLDHVGVLVFGQNA